MLFSLIVFFVIFCTFVQQMCKLLTNLSIYMSFCHSFSFVVYVLIIPAPIFIITCKNTKSRSVAIWFAFRTPWILSIVADLADLASIFNYGQKVESKQIWSQDTDIASVISIIHSRGSLTCYKKLHYIPYT